MCKVSWCNNETEFYNKKQRYAFCPTHIQYKQYARNAAVRPWLMYKVEKVVNNDLCCEHCGDNMVKKYKDVPLKVVLTQMDVDHINPNIKGTPEGEQPSNYQLLCKMCHGIKSYNEGDWNNKQYRNGRK